MYLRAAKMRAPRGWQGSGVRRLVMPCIPGSEHELGGGRPVCRGVSSVPAHTHTRANTYAHACRGLWSQLPPPPTPTARRRQFLSQVSYVECRSAFDGPFALF